MKIYILRAYSKCKKSREDNLYLSPTSCWSEFSYIGANYKQSGPE